MYSPVSGQSHRSRDCAPNSEYDRFAPLQLNRVGVRSASGKSQPYKPWTADIIGNLVLKSAVFIALGAFALPLQADADLQFQRMEQ